MKLYRKESSTVEAVQWTEDNKVEVKAFCPTAIIREVYFATTPIKHQTEIIIPNIVCDHFVNPGDFIIKDKNGYFSSCKENAFHKIYKEVK